MTKLFAWLGRFDKRSQLDVDALDRKFDASLDQTAANQPKVNAITSWLDNRKNQNGFGEDFEYTLRPKEARS